jgi:hypothetical protein
MRAPRQDPPVLLPESSPPATGTGEPPLALAEPPSRVSLWTGGLLILLSFGIYPAYPLVPFLPISLWQKGGVGIGLAVLSWSLFFAGSALVGKRGIAYLKRNMRWHREGQSRPELGHRVPRRQP